MRRLVAGSTALAAAVTGVAFVLLSRRHRQRRGCSLSGLPAKRVPGPQDGSSFEERADAWRSTYLDLALREYLAMRDEMNRTVRLTMSLVTSAFVVAGGVAGALAANVAGLQDDQRGVLLEVVAALGFGIYLTSIGLMNTFGSRDQCAGAGG